ncbi:hypothetical protein ACQ4PT_055204 [Festuca glaucescens]
MGSGLSHNHRSSVSPQQQPLSARVIAADGSLTEFPASYPDVLGDNAGRSFFVCSSDALYFNEDVPALGGSELLRPGQIYFVLPAAMLGQPLSNADMAAMAVRASEAIAPARARPARGAGGVTKSRVAPVHAETGFGDVLDGAVSEKLNERTLREDSLTGSSSPTRNGKRLAAAASPLAKRALTPLGTIEEDAD